MKKAVTQRIKITGTGKMIRRRMGVGHNKAKKTGKQTRLKRQVLLVNTTDVKMFKKYL